MTGEGSRGWTCRWSVLSVAESEDGNVGSATGVYDLFARFRHESINRDVCPLQRYPSGGLEEFSNHHEGPFWYNVYLSTVTLSSVGCVVVWTREIKMEHIVNRGSSADKIKQTKNPDPSTSSLISH